MFLGTGVPSLTGEILAGPLQLPQRALGEPKQDGVGVLSPELCVWGQAPDELLCTALYHDPPPPSLPLPLFSDCSAHLSIWIKPGSRAVWATWTQTLLGGTSATPLHTGCSK